MDGELVVDDVTECWLKEENPEWVVEPSVERDKSNTEETEIKILSPNWRKRRLC